MKYVLTILFDADDELGKFEAEEAACARIAMLPGVALISHTLEESDEDATV